MYVSPVSIPASDNLLQGGRVVDSTMRCIYCREGATCNLNLLLGLKKLPHIFSKWNKSGFFRDFIYNKYKSKITISVLPGTLMDDVGIATST